MHRSTLALVVIAGLAGCGGGTPAETTTTTTTTGSETTTAQQFAQISVDEVSTALEASDRPVAVFDANSPETFAQHHVPGATWVDYDAVSAEQLPTDHATQLVFYCANEQCEASHVAAETASGLGYENVAVMGAGIQGWIAAGKPVEGAGAAEATTTTTTTTH